MKKKLIIGLICLFSHSVVNASCINVLTTMSLDIDKYNQQISNHHLAWMELSWLQKNMGLPSKKDVDNQNQYSWKCNANNFLTVIVVGNNVIKVDGQVSTENGAEIFAAELPSNQNYISTQPAESNQINAPLVTEKQKNNATLATDQPVNQENKQPINDVNKLQLKQAFYQFKQWFNVDLNSHEQLVQFTEKAIVNYYANLKQCIPGTYKYPVPNSLAAQSMNKNAFLYNLAQSTIHGKVSGACQVDTFVTSNDNTLSLSCAYNPDVLNFYSEENAKKASHNLISG